MMENKKIKIPVSLVDAVEILKNYYGKSVDEIKQMSEKTFVNTCHHSLGAYLRNEWNLWWYDGHDMKGWPKKQPKIKSYFESIGITHADDISSIILTSLHRTLHDKDLNINSQVKIYHKHWKEHGFADGIYENK